MMPSIDAAVTHPRQIVPAQGVEIGASYRARWHRQASLATVLGIVARVVTIGARLATIPLALRLLGGERYGLWLCVGSVLAWVSFVGPGLGYGLINAISDASGRDDPRAVRQHVSTATFTLAGAGMLLMMLAPLLGEWNGWPGLLGIANRPELAAEAAVLVGVAALLCALSFSLEFVGPLCSGLQEGYLASIASTIASVLTVIGVVLLVARGGDLISFALVTGVPPILASISLAVYVFWRRYPEFTPSWRLWNRDSARALLGFGGWMVVMQVGDLAIFQSANVLIASRFGAGEVPRYAVSAAIFFNVAQLCYLVVQPYWPVLREASVRQDWSFVRSTVKRTLKIRVAMMAAAATLIISAGPAFIRVWAGEQAVPPRSLLFAMSGYFLLVTVSGNYGVALLGLGFVRLKALLSFGVGVAHIAGFFVLSPYVGLSAIPVAGAFAVLAECLVTSHVASRAILGGMAALEKSRATA